MWNKGGERPILPFFGQERRMIYSTKLPSSIIASIQCGRNVNERPTVSVEFIRVSNQGKCRDLVEVIVMQLSCRDAPHKSLVLVCGSGTPPSPDF